MRKSICKVLMGVMEKSKAERGGDLECVDMGKGEIQF